LETLDHHVNLEAFGYFAQQDSGARELARESVAAEQVTEAASAGQRRFGLANLDLRAPDREPTESRSVLWSLD
jgi:hypothetical protein